MKPLSIRILGGFSLLLGVLLLLDGLFVVVAGALGVPGVEFLKSILVVGMTLMVLGVAYLVVGVGISQVLPWAREGLE